MNMADGINEESLEDLDDTFGGFHQYAIDVSPTFFRGPNGSAMQTTWGLLLDGLLAAARDANMQRLPGQCANDALPFVGAASNLERYPGEDADAYRSRLKNRWRDYSRAGTRPQMIAALKAAGYDAVIYERHDRPDAFPAGIGPSFWVYLPKPNRWRADDGTWSTPGVWGEAGGLADPLAKDREIIRRVVKKWKPANARCLGVVVALSGMTWAEAESLGRTWGGWETAFSGYAWPESTMETIRVR
jgi:Phage tail protein (Tail_P2_I)